MIIFTQKEIELTHDHHFKDIKMLCTADQQSPYQQVVKEKADIFPQQGLRNKR